MTFKLEDENYIPRQFIHAGNDAKKLEEVNEDINIEDVIQQIESLFNNFGNDNHSFTVDYDEQIDGLYCNYALYPNDEGYAVSGDLLFVTQTSQNNLKKLQHWLEEKEIHSRKECEWNYFWRWKE